MDLPPSDGSFEAEGLLGTFPSFGSNEIDFFLKQENFPIDCLQPCDSSAITGNFNDNQEEMQYKINSPDSTEMPTNFVPCATSKLPSMQEYPGAYKFDVELKKCQGDRARWDFSECLKKIFALMNCKIPVTFKWNEKRSGLFVRALPVYLGQDDFEEPVRRCACHSSHMEKSNEGFPYVDHIIRCDHSHTRYETNQETNRLSVVVPLDPPQPGSDGTTVVYSFMCKNSCAVGINRRSTAVIFTLENKNGDVIGRKMLKFRICSCPRRDMMKEESDQKKMEHPVDTDTDTDIVFLPPPCKKVLKRKNMVEPGITNFNIRIPIGTSKIVAKLVKEVISFDSVKENREMTQEELNAVEDCSKYI